MESLKIETATRESIHAHLHQQGDWNRKVRQTLGLREVGNANARMPVFQSMHAQALYTELDKVAKKHLIRGSADQIIDAWLQNGPIQADITHLVDRYGDKLWAEPMVKRNPVLNPNSYLLVVGESPAYSTDLFIELEHHRKYILLQLEHLAFIRAIAFHRNNLAKQAREAGRPARTSKPPSAASTKIVQIGPANVREASGGWTSMKTSTSLVVKLFISSAGLRKVRSAISKRKLDDATSHQEQPPKRQWGQTSKQPSWKDGVFASTQRQQAESHSTTKVPEARDVAGLGRPQSLLAFRSPFANAPQRSLIINLSSDDDDSSEDSALSDNECVPENEVTSSLAHNADGHNLHNEPAREARSPRAVDGDQANSVASEDCTPRTDQGPDLVAMREELRHLLHRDLGTTNRTSPTFSECNKMWEITFKVNALLKQIWTLDAQPGNMTEQQQEKVSKMMDIWISWRDNAGALGTVTGLHPLQEGPVAVITYKQWVDMLGGIDKFREVDEQLSELRAWKRHRDAPTVDEISKHIASALASATRHPAGAEYYFDNIVDYNRKLFSLELDFAICTVPT